MALLEDHINKAPLMLSVLSQGNWVMKNKNFHGTVHSYNMVFVSFNHVKFCYSGGWFLIILFCKCSIRYFDIVRIKASWFVNHKSISWSHKPKICKTYIFHISLFPKYGNFKIINEWMRLFDKRKKIPFNVLVCFKLCCYALTWTIACTDFVNRLHSYEQNQSFMLKDVSFVTILIHKIWDSYLWSHSDFTHTLCLT